MTTITIKTQEGIDVQVKAHKVLSGLFIHRLYQGNRKFTKAPYWTLSTQTGHAVYHHSHKPITLCALKILTTKYLSSMDWTAIKPDLQIDLAPYAIAVQKLRQMLN